MASSGNRARRHRGRRGGDSSSTGDPGSLEHVSWWYNGPFDVDIDIPSISGADRADTAQPKLSRGSSNSVAVVTDPEDDFALAVEPNSVANQPRVSATLHDQFISAPAASEVQGPINIPRIVIGVPSPDLEPVGIHSRFRDTPFRPDIVIDGWSSQVISVRGASLRGHVHRFNGAPRQDDFAIHALQDGRLIAVVADGVSSANQSHLGSTIAVGQAAQWLKRQLPDVLADTNWLSLFKEAAYALMRSAQTMLQLQDLPDVAATEKEMATTLVCAVIEPMDDGSLRASIVGVGDSGAWLLRDGRFIPVLGGKAADESGLSSNAVVGLPRLPDDVRPSVVELRDRDVLLLGTDGFGDPLGGGEGGVGNLFRELFAGRRPPSLVEFAHALDFSRETFDDDRTLIAVMLRQPGE